MITKKEAYDIACNHVKILNESKSNKRIPFKITYMTELPNLFIIGIKDKDGIEDDMSRSIIYKSDESVKDINLIDLFDTIDAANGAIKEIDISQFERD